MPPIAVAAGRQHHNTLNNQLFGRDATPTKSSPIAQQRLLTMSAAAAFAAQEEQPSPSGGCAGAESDSAAHSISFGSGCRQGDTAGSSGSGEWRRLEENHPRLAALARVLERAERAGQQLTLPQLHAAGYSTSDVLALKALLA